MEEGRQLLRRFQFEVINAQARANELCRRRCADCRRPRPVKDIRTKCVQTLFGAFRLRGRRFHSCRCQSRPDDFRQDFPLGEIIPRRTTPEVRFLFAELGAAMRIVTDGDDGLRNFVQRNIPTIAAMQLDCFPIGMRLENLRKAVGMPMTYEEFRASLQSPNPRETRVSKLRDALWRGRSWRALLQFARLRRDVDRWEAEGPHHSADAADRTRKTIDEFRKYVCGNRRALPDFAKERAAGHRISTAHVESVMHHLVNHRLSKKQQMRWSPEAADSLLQVRAELLNDSLLNSYRVDHPRFRGPSQLSHALG